MKADLAAEVLSGARNVIVLDVEATCWRNNVWNRQKETIEIGAVRYTPGRSPRPRDELQTFVRPKRHPRLSQFCVDFTGITQQDVDAAPSFPEALKMFLDWAEPLDRLLLATWSPYDLWQLDLDLEQLGLPKLSFPHLDVKKLASAALKKKSLGRKSLKSTAELLGVPLPADRHRALADARMTAAILDRLLAR
jgi:3'-5' exoribonuclease 1